MTRRLLLVLVALLVLTGCGARLDSPSVVTTPDGTAGTAPMAALHDGTTAPSPAPPIVPLPNAVGPTNRMTGTYPPHCTARVDPAGHWHPDPVCDPGLVRRDITDDNGGPRSNIATTICTKGYTETSNRANPGARPPASNTEPVKQAAMRAYGIPVNPDTERTTEGDHVIPLELGGVNATENYAPEPSDLPGKGTANTKDRVEGDLHAAVCRPPNAPGHVWLAQAQTAIATDWTTAEQRLGLVGAR